MAELVAMAETAVTVVVVVTADQSLVEAETAEQVELVAMVATVATDSDQPVREFPEETVEPAAQWATVEQVAPVVIHLSLVSMEMVVQVAPVAMAATAEMVLTEPMVMRPRPLGAPEGMAAMAVSVVTAGLVGSLVQVAPLELQE